ncbi:MAG TPA: hypothetical protein VGR00_08745 [Thermoanaerobaculia bacterium]|jgi:hypothetical protein|nr:hypothetical protein [Thermoanaerobaculia bacterium]
MNDLDRRRLGGAAVVLAGLVALVVPSVLLDTPLGVSLRVARRFWSANEATRILNSPSFIRDRELGLQILSVDRDLPLSENVALVLAPAVPSDRAEEIRRKAALLLAPRRVRLRREPSLPRPYAFERDGEGR